MEEAKMVVLAVVIAIVVSAAIFTSIDVFLALSAEKTAHRGRLLKKEKSYGYTSKKNYMTKEPKLPHKLKWGDRTAARVDEVEYLIGIRVVGYTGLKDVLIAEVHESVADEVGAWRLPEDLKSIGSSDVFMKKPRAGAYYKYIKLKDIVHEES